MRIGDRTEEGQVRLEVGQSSEFTILHQKKET